MSFVASLASVASGSVYRDTRCSGGGSQSARPPLDPRSGGIPCCHVTLKLEGCVCCHVTLQSSYSLLYVSCYNIFIERDVNLISFTDAIADGPSLQPYGEPYPSW